MRRWRTAGNSLPVGLRVPVALGVAVIAQQLIVGITQPEMVAGIIIGLATVAGSQLDRRRESSSSAPGGDGPSPSPRPPEPS